MPNTIYHINFFALLLLSSMCSPQVPCDTIPEKFAAALRNNSMACTVPVGFLPAAMVSNTDVRYQYGIRHPTANIEIRYLVVGLSASSNRDQANAAFKTTALAYQLNISGGEVRAVKSLGREAIKALGADWAGVATVPLHSVFGAGYLNCTMLCLHKKNVADGYVFILYGGMDDLTEDLLRSALGSLRFIS